MQDMNKKTVLLFSTRFLEGHDELFSGSISVQEAFCKNEAYCEFFFTSNADDELKHYLYDAYIIPHLKKDFPDDIGSDACTFQTALEPLKSKFPSLCNTIRQERRGGYPHVYSTKDDLLKDNKNNSNVRKEVPKTDLLKYIVSCPNKDYEKIKSIKLDIDCDLNTYEIGWRFKLYKLKLPEGCCFSVYAVWALNESVKHDEFKWYEALCKEIKNQEGKGVEEIYLFLHDKDIESSTFKVRHYNKTNKDTTDNCDFSFLEDGAKLNVALFQHNDKIGGILKSTPTNDEEKIKLLKIACEEIEKGGKLTFLNDLSDCVACWHNGGREEYIKKVSTEKINNTYGLKKLILDITDNTDVEDILKRIKEEIDILMKQYDDINAS